MRVLGIDVGLKRTGMAMSDETGNHIKLLPNLLARSRALALEKLLSLVNEFAVDIVVIGCPAPKTSGSIAISRRAHGLKNALDEALMAQGQKTVSIVLWDEADTSKRALAMLVTSHTPQKKRKLLLDAQSAAVLVEDFIACNKK